MGKKRIQFITIEDVRNFVRICSRYNENINLYSKHFIVDAKCLMGVFALDLNEEKEVEILTIEKEVYNTFYLEIEEAGIAIELR